MKKENLYEAIGLINDEHVESLNKLRTKKKNNKTLYIKIISVAACFCILFTAIILGLNSKSPIFDTMFVSVRAEDLMEGITPRYVEAISLEDKNTFASDFAFKLLSSVNADSENENILISPLSVICALSMTANGADGETKAQIESVLGMSTDELNKYLYSYLSSLVTKNDVKINLANSIWFKDLPDFAVNRSFLQTNADYYGASVYKAPFDKSTLKDINNWVKKNTDGMIPKILDRIPEDAMMYLVNTLVFDGEWMDMYLEHQYEDGIFTLENGSKEEVGYLVSEETEYLETEKATGFIKYYKNARYAFAALLPNEDVTVSELLDSFDGETLASAMENKKYYSVDVKLPKFKTEYSTELSETLKKMGMSNAFEWSLADFSKMSNEQLYVGRVLHKAYIEVNERGTRAGAATAVEMNCGGMYIEGDKKEVYLDRPFVYMLIDCETNTPFFIGTMMNPNA
jgi:serpin B